jgi:hypothetical protein
MPERFHSSKMKSPCRVKGRHHPVFDACLLCAQEQKPPVFEYTPYDRPARTTVTPPFPPPSVRNEFINGVLPRDDLILEPDPAVRANVSRSRKPARFFHSPRRWRTEQRRHFRCWGQSGHGPFGNTCDPRKARQHDAPMERQAHRSGCEMSRYFFSCRGWRP